MSDCKECKGTQGAINIIAFNLGECSIRKAMAVGALKNLISAHRHASAVLDKDGFTWSRPELDATLARAEFIVRQIEDGECGRENPLIAAYEKEKGKG